MINEKMKRKLKSIFKLMKQIYRIKMTLKKMKSKQIKRANKKD